MTKRLPASLAAFGFFLVTSVRKRTWSSPTGAEKAAWSVDYIDSEDKRQRKQFANKKVADAFRIDLKSQLFANARNVTNGFGRRCGWSPC